MGHPAAIHPADITPLRAAGITVRDLYGGLVVAVAVGSVVDQLTRFLPILPRRAAAAICALAVLILIGRLWGRDIAKLLSIADTKSAEKRAAWGFAVPVIIVGIVLSVSEPFAVARGASAGLPIHTVYKILFVSSTLFLVTTATYALIRGFANSAEAMSIALRIGIVAAATFLVIAVVMQALGWQVGAPNAAHRATMIVVTLTSVLGATLAAGATLGYFLERLPRTD